MQHRRIAKDKEREQQCASCRTQQRKQQDFPRGNRRSEQKIDIHHPKKTAAGIVAVHPAEHTGNDKQHHHPQKDHTQNPRIGKRRIGSVFSREKNGG